MATRVAIYGIVEEIGVRDLEFWESVRHTLKSLYQLGNTNLM